MDKQWELSLLEVEMSHQAAMARIRRRQEKLWRWTYRADVAFALVYYTVGSWYVVRALTEAPWMWAFAGIWLGLGCFFVWSYTRNKTRMLEAQDDARGHEENLDQMILSHTALLEQIKKESSES